MKINEEIGRNYKTIDPSPIDFFHDPRVQVEIFPDGFGKHAVQITCPDLNYESDLQTFADENEAVNWARNQYTSLITKLDSIIDIQEAVIKRLLRTP
tara:strand:+ start:7962 stop:8252 length:291 start_codon:yes stop_codon:yes gene_type:complete